MKNTPERIKEQLDRLYDTEDKLSTILETAGKDNETQYKKKYLETLDVLRDFNKKLYKLLNDTYLSTIVDLDEMVNEKPLDAQGVELGGFGKVSMESVAKGAYLK